MTGQKPDPTGAKILDGAARVLGDFGFKRATVELVAKYAGVSHMTIYRRWPSKNELLIAALTGEFTNLLDAAFAPSEEQSEKQGGSYAERALEAFIDTVWAVQSHPIVLRELNTDAGEQSPIFTGASSGVMGASIPLIAERLRQLGATAEDAPPDLDPVADMFVRLGYSLVAVRRPDRPLTTREQVAQYASESFGPYLQALTPKTAPASEAAAPVIEFGGHRPPKFRPHRLTGQVAAASVLSVLTLGAGLAAVIGGDVTLPFVNPANVSRPTTATTSPDVPPEPPGTPTDSDQQRRPGPSPEPFGAPPEASGAPAESSGAESSDPGPFVPGSAVQPAEVPSPSAIPQIAPVQRSAAAVGSVGGNSGPDNNPIARNPASGPQPIAVAVAEPSPTAPKPQPPAPPKPSPKPPPPNPKPPAPQPAPKQSGNGGKQHQSGSGQQSGSGHQSGSGKQSGSGNQSGSGKQSKQQHG